MSRKLSNGFVTPPTTGSIACRPSCPLHTTKDDNVTVPTVAHNALPVLVNHYQAGVLLCKDDVVYAQNEPQNGLI